MRMYKLSAHLDEFESGINEQRYCWIEFKEQNAFISTMEVIMLLSTHITEVEYKKSNFKINLLMQLPKHG